MSQSLNPRSAADLAKLNSQADERQVELDRRDKELLIREAKQKEDFKYSEARLDHLKGQIAKLESKLEDNQKLLGADIDELKLKRRELTKELEDRKAELTPIEQTISTRGHVLREAERQIKDRNDYLVTQEAQVEVVIEALNDQLKALSVEVAGLTTQKEELLRQNYTLEADKGRTQRETDLLLEEVGLQGDKVDELTALYNSKAAEFKAALQKEKQKRQLIIEANEGLAHTLDDREHKVELREKEVAVQADILKKADADILTRRRKLESDLSLL